MGFKYFKQVIVNKTVTHKSVTKNHRGNVTVLYVTDLYFLPIFRQYTWKQNAVMIDGYRLGFRHQSLSNYCTLLEKY